MKTAAIIVSAGKSLRFPGEKKKQFLSLAGKPVLCHTLDRFHACSSIDLIELIVSPEDREYCLKEIVEPRGYTKISGVVDGGEQRQDSVGHGIDALPPEVDMVVIHDGVRPFVTPEMIDASIEGARKFKAAVIAVPVKETIKRSAPDRFVLETLDRESLWQIQTPQTFRAEVIRRAFRKAIEDHFVATDDAALVERIGIKVYILPGSYSNIKITTPEDLALAHRILQAEEADRRNPG